MSDRKKGCWRLSWHDPKTGEPNHVFMVDGYIKLHKLDAPNDCDGDVLFDYMTKNGIIESFDNYEAEVDNEHVAIMCKGNDRTDYSWDFKPFAEPVWPSDDCHTFS